jgi:N-acetylglucosaminyldiphosphoundecaprenol N-acetyl-beta-D-mannosaminyltransferase
MGGDSSRCNVLGVGVHAVNLASAADALGAALRERRKGYVCVTGVHGIMEAQRDPRLRQILNTALLNVPDGMPVVWVGRRQGYPHMGRVYGPDLLAAVGQRSVEAGWRHFLYGGREGVAAKLQQHLETRFPGIRIVGTYSPPFRPLEARERADVAGLLARGKPDVMWVGLSTPKQERFMAEHLAGFDVTVMAGIGAAFDICTGRIKDAPAWMKRAGLQWLHRLGQEPRRLGRRYGYIVPAFLFNIALQQLGWRKYSLDKPA